MLAILAFYLCLVKFDNMPNVRSFVAVYTVEFCKGAGQFAESAAGADTFVKK
jgi:hypothetical protein